MFNTPITTNDSSLNKVLGQKLPILLILFDRPVKAVDDTLAQLAKENAGNLLVVRVNASENPAAYAQYGRPALPALVAVQGGDVKACVESAAVSDFARYADYLLGRGPLPTSAAPQRAESSSSAATPVLVTDQVFSSQVLQSNVPVLVDFWAPWCGPCHKVAPTLERLAQRYGGQIKVAKLNVDENPVSAQQYRATSIPLLLMFKGGKVVGKLVGAHAEETIERMVQEALR